MIVNHSHKFIFVHVPKAAGDAVALHCRSDGLRDHQPDSRTALCFPSCVHDDVRLHRSNPMFDRGAELRRPCHPVLSREHAA